MDHSTSIFLVLAILIENAILMEEMADEFKKEFAKKYNDVRSRYARGEVEGFPSVTNMMEASWSDNAAKLADQVVNQLCSNGNYSITVDQNHILVSSSENENDTLEVWADGFYRDPKLNNNETIQQTIRPEVTEIGCAVSMCRNVSYAVCVHGKINCSGDCIKYDEGPVCSKCPTGSKCTFDGLCSTRKDASNTVTRISLQDQSGFVRKLNIARTKIAIGSQGFHYDEKVEPNGIQFPDAAKMMEVRWSDSAASIAESAMANYCKNGTTATIKIGKYELGASSYYTQYYNKYDVDYYSSKFLKLSNVAFPLFLTSEYVSSEKYTEFFSWKRRQIFTAREEITEMGCSMEFCRGEAVTICAVGEISCVSNCTIYKKGKICSKCPNGSKCTFDYLCSTRKDATNKFTKISKENQAKIVDTINEGRSKIAKGEFEISVNLAGEKVNQTLAPATNMMEIKWDKIHVDLIVELRLTEWCKFAGRTSDDYDWKYAAWSFPVSMENSSRNSSVWDIPLDIFKPSNVEWPQVMTNEEQHNGMFLDVFSRNRFDMFLSWASITTIGCAMEYCRGEIIMICDMGSFSSCLRKCRVYQNGTTCSNCPENSICAENGLCRLQTISTTTAPPDEAEQIIEASLKESGQMQNLINFDLLILISIYWFFTSSFTSAG